MGKLISPLKTDRRYCVEYFLKRGYPAFGADEFASDGFGIYFTKDSVVSTGCCTPPYIPQIRNPYGNVIYDTSWIAMSGSFIAQGGERFFIVGNFKDADETVFDPPLPYAETYYFFDDFSVWLCDTVQLPVLDIDAQLPGNQYALDSSSPLVIPTLLSIYGNSTWQIGNLPENSKVSLFNALGQLVYLSENYLHELTARQIAAGMYFYEITPPAAKMQKGKLVVIR